MDKKNLLQGIDTVIVRVSDIEKAKEWYLHKLGLNSIYEDTQIGLVVVDTNGPTSLTLWKTEERIDINKKSTSFPIFKTTDAKTLRQQLLDNAVDVTELSEDESIKYFQFYDLDGNILEACETLEPMWTPIRKAELVLQMQKAEEVLEGDLLTFWRLIRIEPEKWSEEEFGNEGGGFWVVAIYGRKVIWYNDIEDGFNVSDYKSYGVIDDYSCEQDELNWTLIKLYR